MGECSIPLSPKASLPICVEYPTNEYFNFSCDSNNASFPYLWKEFVSKFLILMSSFSSLPGCFTTIEVFSSWYCKPPSNITTSTISPFSTTALNFAPKPVPIPTTSKSGAVS